MDAKIIGGLVLLAVIGIMIAIGFFRAKREKQPKKAANGVFSSMSDEELRYFFHTCKEKMKESDGEEELADVMNRTWDEMDARRDAVEGKYKKFPVSERAFPSDDEIKKYTRETLYTFSDADLDFLFHYIDDMVRLGRDDFRDIYHEAFMILIDRKAEAEEKAQEEQAEPEKA